MFTDATRAEWIAGVALLVTVAFGISSWSQDKGAMQRSIENNQVLLAQRNRENDLIQQRVLSLETALRNCRP